MMEVRPDNRSNMLFLLSMLVYPFLVLSMCFMIFLAFEQNIDFGMCNVFFLVWTIFYLAIMEALIPYDMSWRPTIKEWLRDLVYLIITMLGGGMAVIVVHGISAYSAPQRSSLPLWLEIILALIMSSLGSYIFHRVSHIHPWLWRVHGIHHVEQKVNVGNNGVNHFLDVLGRRFLALLPLMLLGFSEEALFIIGMFNTMQGYFSHANVCVYLGWLNYFVVSPEQHRLHHSKDLNEAGHYGTDVPLWDLLFGSYTWKNGKKPKAIGVVDPNKFPSPDNIIAGMLNPWRRHYIEK
ncbi:MAG: sterol desaturase family protein [Myxococcales bacterium]|nr:sterol desaturase family protein [Myxococcales bacterium]USN50165.1 MAG: sterol desaturase family protein [Myxococcales bacterium]